MNFMWFSNLIFFEEMQILCLSGLLPLTHVFRQLDNEPAEIPIEVASFIRSFTMPFSRQITRRTQYFFKRAKILKSQTFPKSCGEHSKKISSFEELLHGKVLFSSQLETKSQFGYVT